MRSSTVVDETNPGSSQKTPAQSQAVVIIGERAHEVRDAIKRELGCKHPLHIVRLENKYRNPSKSPLIDIGDSQALMGAETQLVVVESEKNLNVADIINIEDWCRDYEYELVFMEPSQERMVEMVEHNEKWGLARILETLNNVQWPQRKQHMKKQSGNDKVDHILSILEEMTSSDDEGWEPDAKDEADIVAEFEVFLAQASMKNKAKPKGAGGSKSAEASVNVSLKRPTQGAAGKCQVTVENVGGGSGKSRNKKKKNKKGAFQELNVKVFEELKLKKNATVTVAEAHPHAGKQLHELDKSEQLEVAESICAQLESLTNFCDNPAPSNPLASLLREITEEGEKIRKEMKEEIMKNANIIAAKAIECLPATSEDPTENSFEQVLQAVTHKSSGTEVVQSASKVASKALDSLADSVEDESLPGASLESVINAIARARLRTLDPRRTPSEAADIASKVFLDATCGLGMEDLARELAIVEAKRARGEEVELDSD